MYVNAELAEVMSVALRGASNLNKKIEAVEGDEDVIGTRESIHESYISTMVVWASGEPYLVVNAEDAWYEGRVLSTEEAEIVREATAMLLNPHFYVEKKRRLTL